MQIRQSRTKMWCRCCCESVCRENRPLTTNKPTSHTSVRSPLTSSLTSSTRDPWEASWSASESTFDALVADISCAVPAPQQGSSTSRSPTDLEIHPISKTRFPEHSVASSPLRFGSTPVSQSRPPFYPQEQRRHSLLLCL